MPVLKHAKKKLRQDKQRTLQNKKVKDLYKKLVKKAREVKSEKAITVAFSSVDKAVKNNIIHKNKGARLKSSLAKITSKSASKPVAAKKAAPAKKTASKKPAAKKAPAKKAAVNKPSAKKSLN